MALIPVTLRDPNYLQTTLVSTFFIAFHVFVVSEDKDFKFGR